MKFGFVTCVQLGLSCMEAIYEAGATLDLVITLPDDKAVGKSGRVYVDDFCRNNRVPLLKAGHINDQAVRDRIEHDAIDWLFIIGWSQIAGNELLAAPTLGVLGIHPTLLPVGRGRAAIPWAILKQLDRTGVTLFKLDSGVDTGPVVAQHEIPLSPDVDAAKLYNLVNDAHVLLIRDAIPRLVRGELPLVEQDEAQATFWPGRKPEDGEIALDGSVHEAERLVRAVTRPYPGAFFVQDGTRTVVWRARVANGLPQGGEPMLHFHDGILILDDVEISTIDKG
ncbi:methionyl-tRNA formyltransferase [Sphingopyxis macrogoltabida]|uniref:Methionyl-tRNA formyltransferase n=2 Tax=Sphingopyxis macrogoltabida TaxID=33050 RepID=A0A0N9UQR9_SPHMC|nr:methionyl-tRNA formyltransferase [Sphingopyxis macrogoltabida]